MCDIQTIQLKMREAIESSGLSQKEIARQIGVSAQTVSKYMRENVFPALDTFAKLCKCLDVPADYILGISDYF